MSGKVTPVKAYVFLVIAGAVAGLVIIIAAFLQNGGNNFYVRSGETQYSGHDSGVEFTAGEYLFFYPEHVVKPKSGGFKVSILLNIKQNDSGIVYYFTTDGYLIGFDELNNVTGGFDIGIYDKYFTLYFPSSFTVKDFLQNLYPDKEIDNISDDIDLSQKDFFKIVVTSDGGETVSIGFRIKLEK